MNTKHMLKFNYPIKYIIKSWEYPWNLYKWYHWFFRIWKTKNKNEKTEWKGLIILGFKRIKVVYTCDEKTAKKEHNKGLQRLNNFLMDLIEGKRKIEDLI